MNYTDNWEETKQRFNAWWKRSGMDRPLMRIAARKSEGRTESGAYIYYPKYTPEYESPEDYHLNVRKKVEQYQYYYRTHKLYAEAFPNIDINLGAGSIALYLGCEPEFAEYTIWFKECVEGDWSSFGRLKFDPDNKWWLKHLEMIKQAKEMLRGDMPVCIPDLVENVDILSALRGPQQLCYDLIDEPEVIADYINQLDDLYFKYYDAIYDLVKLEDGSSIYTVFQVWGPGRTAKVQCDFCAMMSPSQFRDLVVPSLRKQCQRLDNSIYHLDGPDAIKHLDALLSIEELDAIQWTPGAGKPDGASEEWYPIYDRIIGANKGLWIGIEKGTFSECVEKARKLVNRYGPDQLYILFPEMSEEEAENLVALANREWKTKCYLSQPE